MRVCVCACVCACVRVCACLFQDVHLSIEFAILWKMYILIPQLYFAVFGVCWYRLLYAKIFAKNVTRLGALNV